ncbi:MAG TPA: M20/M25/M40 family metallo-hydrolase [Bryobacteraceae bacterium]|jgi:glutamate carboxypeptidase
MRTLLFILPAVMLAQAPSGKEAAMVSAVDAEAPAAVTFLERIVNMNSGTFNPAGVQAVADVLEAQFRSLGFSTRQLSGAATKRGPHLIAELKGSPNRKRVLLIGHMDTVFELSSPFQKFDRKSDEHTDGPGTSDMKGGLVVMLSALKAMKAAGALDGANITVFITGDEEAAGDPLAVSRAALIAAGKASDYALCFEGGASRDGKDYGTIARRGSASWRLTVHAKTGHSSQIFSDSMGDGAAFEVARIVNAFREQLREPNMTFSVGMILSGNNIQLEPGGHASVSGKSNIVPGEALAIGDVRALTRDQVARVKDKMQSILAKNLKGTRAELQFEDRYPPMSPTAGNQALLDKLNGVNATLGQPVMEALDPMLRGAGDISFIAPYVDSITGMGAYGGGGHAPGEWINLTRQPLQAKRAALLIYRLTR